MIWLVAYLWALLFVYGLVVSHLVPHPRTGWDLLWRSAAAPILLPILVLAKLIKGTR